MKTGRTLQDLAAELDRQLETRRDYVAPQGALEMVAGNGQVRLAGLNTASKPINSWAHGQLAASLAVPKLYYDRMLAEEPELLAKNVNTWFKKNPDRKRLIRTLDGTVRASLSDRYRTLDSLELLRVALPAATEMKAEIISCQVTETRMYLKMIFPELSDPAPMGMTLGQGHGRVHLNIAALILQNSEVGASTLRADVGFFSTSCTNLAVMSDWGMRKTHIGRSAMSELDSAVELFSDETKQQDDKAFWMKVRDVIAASCNRDIFMAQMAKVHAAAGEKIESENIPAVIEVTAKKFGFGDSVKNAVLKHLIQGADLSKWGLTSAITRASSDVEDYDQASDLERVGGKVIELGPAEWRTISQAA